MGCIYILKIPYNYYRKVENMNEKLQIYIKKNIQLMCPMVNISEIETIGENNCIAEYYNEKLEVADEIVYWQDITNLKIYFDWDKMVKQISEKL